MYRLIAIMCAILLPNWAQSADSDWLEDETAITIEAVMDNPAKASGEVEKKSISELIRELDLSEEQKAQAKNISDANRAKAEQLQDKLRDILQQARNLEEESLKEFYAILTDEQKAKFEEFKKLRDEELKAHDEMIEDIMAPFNE